MERPGIFTFLQNLQRLNEAEETCSEKSDESISSGAESEYESENDEVDLDEEWGNDENENIVYVSRDGQCQWESRQPDGRRRRNQHNILRHLGGVAPHVNPRAMSESVNCFLTDDMLKEIIKFTNLEAIRHETEWNPLCLDELRGFLGILFLIGTLRGGHQSIRDFWDNDFGQNAIIATMSRGRFVAILKNVRFDDRNKRDRNDRLAPIRCIWEMFLRNCRRCIVPAPFVCVDEQIVATRGRCPFRIYMKNKPHKYGIKVWVLADENGFFCDGDIYLGRMPGRPREVDQGLRVVMQLCHPLQNSGCHVTVDNFFTSVALAKSLRSKGLSMSGTLRKSRREISASFLQKRPHLTSLFAYMDGIQLTSYMAKPSKCVLLLSTLHNNNSIEAEDLNKPHSVVNYNR